MTPKVMSLVVNAWRPVPWRQALATLSQPCVWRHPQYWGRGVDDGCEACLECAMGNELHGEVRAALREAPFDSAAWPRALDALARACGAASVQLLSFGPSGFTPVMAPGFSGTEIADFIAMGGADPQTNHGLRAVRGSRPHQIIVDAEYLTDGQRSKDRLYSDFFRRFDGDYVASGTVARAEAWVCNLNLFMPRKTKGLGVGARRTLGRLLPEFTQAMRSTLRVGDVATSLAASAWNAMDVAVLVCDADGRVQHANPEAESLIAGEPGLRIVGGRLEGMGQDASDRLGRALREATDSVAQRPSRLSVRMARGVVFVLDVVPLPLSSFAFESRALVFLRMPGKMAGLDEALLATEFRLTAAECQVAMAIMRRLSSSEIARIRGVSIETVNTQVKSLLSKTGCANRGEMTLLLQGFERRQRTQ